MTVDQIIKDLGGFTAVSKEINVPLTTVHSWKRANVVPEWRKPTLLALAKKKRIALTNEDFPTSAQAAA